MKRILLMVLRNLWFVPYGWFKLCYTAAHVEKYTEEERYQILKMIDRRANIGGRITIDAYGVENIPKQDGFMFFPNHQGLYDVLAILEVCPRPFSVVMKKEVENVPFLKQVFACMKAIPLDRNDLRRVAGDQTGSRRSERRPELSDLCRGNQKPEGKSASGL